MNRFLVKLTLLTAASLATVAQGIKDQCNSNNFFLNDMHLVIWLCFDSFDISKLFCFDLLGDISAELELWSSLVAQNSLILFLILIHTSYCLSQLFLSFPLFLCQVLFWLFLCVFLHETIYHSINEKDTNYKYHHMGCILIFIIDSVEIKV